MQTSYRIKIDPRRRHVSRFISRVVRELQRSYAEEKERRGVTQASLARRLGVNRSVVNRRLRGDANLTLESVAELAFELNAEIEFALRRSQPEAGVNHHVGAETLITPPALRIGAPAVPGAPVLPPPAIKVATP